MHRIVVAEKCGKGEDDAIRERGVVEQESGAGDVDTRAGRVDGVADVRDAL